MKKQLRKLVGCLLAVAMVLFSVNASPDGIYEKPRYSTLLEDFLPTDPEKVAYAIARNYHWTISPSGDIALNKLGLSTQVPTVWSYISDGPYREFAWDNIRLKYKHKTNREISFLRRLCVLKYLVLP